MEIFIDGYNLLHAAGVFPSGEPSFPQVRAVFLAWLAEQLSANERKVTTVVFDAALAPPGLPSQEKTEGISVRFSRKKTTADDLLEELISACKAPKELTVVSSDHRVQRAARSRGATYFDSDEWCRIRAASSAAASRASASAAEKPAEVNEAEKQRWLKEFGVG